MRKALAARYDGDTKQAAKTPHDNMVARRLEAKENSAKFYLSIDNHRAQLEDLEEPVPDRRFEAITLRVLPLNYEFV